MAATYVPPSYSRVVLLVLGREAVSKLLSPWFFVVATMVCLIAFAYGAGFQNTFETESVLVTSDPLAALHIVVVVFLALVLGLRLATSLSWEREHRTLEVLLVGPVPLNAVLLAKFLAETCVFVALVAIYWLYLILAQPLGAGVVSFGDSLSLLRMPAFALPVMALGVLVSAWALSVRAAVVIYLAVAGILAGYEALLGVLRTMPAEEMSLAALYARATLETVSPVVSPLSPAAHLSGMAQRLFRHEALGTWQISAALLLSLGMLAVAYVIARARGPQG